MMEMVSLVLMIVAFFVVIMIDTAQKRAEYQQKADEPVYRKEL